jgi:FMN phosphatase YigB (HAD superfamily)
MALKSPKQTLIMLDVDNTLYEEVQVGIESQIVQNTHSYCEQVLNLSADQADEMYRKYGSTVEGLKEELWKDLSEEDLKSQLDAFYRQVYKGIDMSKLLLVDLPGESSTGYSHANDQKLLCRLLSTCPLPICLASNSPSWHVEKVLEVMGLAKPLRRAHRFTPDRHSSFPTKNTPQAFFSSTDLHFPNYDNLLFFDDSQYNLERVCGMFTNAEGIHISSKNSLVDALLRTLGLVDPAFEFNQVKYLESKNLVDRKAMDSETWNRVIREMKDIQETEDGPIRIVDVGAGLLSMLDLFLHGDRDLDFMPLKGCRIDYVAYESNRDLYEKCHELLLSWGFKLQHTDSTEEFIYSKKNVELRFVVKDFGSSEALSEPPQLIVGCCFADLLDPNQLVPSLMRTFRLLETDNTLLYFPITFCGTTQFLPPLPFDQNGELPIPSDTLAFRLYSKALTETLAHNLNPLRLQQTMENFGMRLLAKSGADWKIDPKESPYLFDTMMYFFGTAGGPQLMEEGWDGPGWIARSKQRRPKIQVSNVDLLFRAGKSSVNGVEQSQDSQDTIQEILFTDPGKVATLEKPIPDLGPNQVLSTWCRRSFALV